MTSPPPRQPAPSAARGRMEQRGRRKRRAIPLPPYPPSTMHSPMTCAHPAPSSSSPLMAQPAVFVGVVSHHLGLTSPRRLRRLLCFLPHPPPSCVLVSSVVAPNPDEDNDDNVDDAVSVASTATTTAVRVCRLRDWVSRYPSTISPSSSPSLMLPSSSQPRLRTPPHWSHITVAQSCRERLSSSSSSSISAVEC